MRPCEQDERPTRLKITDDKGFEKLVLVDRDVFPIGRTVATGLRLPEEAGDTVADRHATILRDGLEFVIQNESWPRATRVNGRPVRRAVLRHGDVIRLGESPFQILFLVEGTRAADIEEKRTRVLLATLQDLHTSLNLPDIAARAVAGIMQLLSPVWTTVSLDAGQGRLSTVSAGDVAGLLPDAPTRVAQRVMKTARSYFQPGRVCTVIPAGHGHLGVIELGPRESLAYSARDLELLEAIAAHVGVAMTNARRLEGISFYTAIPQTGTG